MSHLRPLKPKQAVASIIRPQMMELAEMNAGDAFMPSMLQIMRANALPHVAD